jgi:hypothetical protein
MEITRNQLRKACRVYKCKKINRNSTDEHMVSELLNRMSEEYDMGFTWCLGRNYVRLENRDVAEGNNHEKVDRKAVYEVLKIKNNIFSFK